MRRREEEKRQREEEKAEREAARRSALEKTGKQSRRDLQKNLSKRPQYHGEEDQSVPTNKKARYRGGEEEKYMREEASWNPNHQTKKRQQQNVGVEDLMGFNEMNEGEEEEEIQEVPRERQGKVHTLFPPIIPIYASGQSSLMPSLSSSVTGPRLAPGPWSGMEPRQAQGLPSRAGQGTQKVPQKKKKRTEKQPVPIIPNLPRSLPGIAISKVKIITCFFFRFPDFDQ